MGKELLPNEVGGYAQVAGLGGSIGFSYTEGFSIGVFVQGSMIIAGTGMYGVTIDPRDWDLFGDDDPNDAVFSFGGAVCIGGGTPTGLPGLAVTAMECTNGGYYGSIGGGVNDAVEAGFYGMSLTGDTLDPERARELQADQDLRTVTGQNCSLNTAYAPGMLDALGCTPVVAEALGLNIVPVRDANGNVIGEKVVLPPSSVVAVGGPGTFPTSSNSSSGSGISSIGDLNIGNGGSTSSNPGPAGSGTQAGGTTNTGGTTVVTDPRVDIPVPSNYGGMASDGYIPGGNEHDEGRRPVIMDLDGDGVEVSLPVMTFFDMDDDGYVEQTAAWAGPDDGFLVIDLNADGTRGKGDGKIDQTSELVLSEWGNAGDTDLQALARAFDKNKDGVLNDNDTVWNELKIWQDLDQDGVTDKNELKTLSQLGITKINLTYDDGSAYSKTSDDIDVGVAVLHGMASYTKDGKVVTGGVGDMTLVHADLGWRRVETDYGYAIEFETGEELRYGVVKEGVGSANINLDTLVLDGAQGDDRANSLIATGHSRSVQISGGDGGDGNDVLRRRRGMIPGWPGQPRAGGGLDVQCGSGRPLPVAGNG